MKSKIKLFKLESDENIAISVLPAKVKAGGYGSFESPALDFPEDTIDLLKLLIKDKETTFFAKVTGDSLIGIGVYNEDILIVQKGLFPRENDIVVVFYQGEFYVKRYKPKYKENSLRLEKIKLKSENPNYSDMDISEDTDFELWGVSTWNLHKLRK
ncbi:LexA family protein [Cloacibacterium normanense]|uniref:Peptidase S24-like family protein n=1 Tax=Cloacibacterium normanense TaxID=237258 RepID=A0A1E5UH65_9FLAO|nr:S24 family peptidase [Cloacibacterium normanense]OEL12216.1 peptidase S24-like family protein [Cloacibacterium normanense]SDO52524.1 SOS response UmuD protein. Serine peptidase. MEROPS family S24 [Cloacibacterium normanense]